MMCCSSKGARIVVGVDSVWSARLSDAKLHSDTYTQNHIATLNTRPNFELDSNMVVLYIGQLATVISTWKVNTGWQPNMSLAEP